MPEFVHVYTVSVMQCIQKSRGPEEITKIICSEISYAYNLNQYKKIYNTMINIFSSIYVHAYMNE